MFLIANNTAQAILSSFFFKYACWFSAIATSGSRQKALADLHQMQTVNMEELSDVQRRPESQLKFITDAWQQYSCRHVES
ncbi:unnamed protein product [Prunus armeniaca]